MDRKMATAIIDMVAGLLALLSGRFLIAADAEFVRQLWLLCQPVVGALILRWFGADQAEATREIVARALMLPGSPEDSTIGE